ncbi:hypothetical protein D918_03334 [Trichuris suis]|nr:hypothetical protein D918_03334 [Trichuris suis]
MLIVQEKYSGAETNEDGRLKHHKSTEKADHNGSDEKKLMKPNVNSMSSNGVQMRQIMNELVKIWAK